MHQFTQKIEILPRYSSRSAPRIPILLTIFSLLFVIPAEATTYYVSQLGSDDNSCAQAQDDTTQSNQKLTISAGLGCLSAGGDTLYIHGGTYNDVILETSFGTSGTSWDSFLTVSAYPGETVILQPTFGPGAVARFQDDMIHHVLVQNITLDGIFEGGGTGAAVLSADSFSHDLHFNNVEVMNSDEEGIVAFGSYLEFRDMKVHSNGQSVPPFNGAEGVYVTGSYNTFIGGEYYDNECFGIRIWDSNHPANLATNNSIVGATFHNNGYGLGKSGASTCFTGGGGFTVNDSNNMVANNLIYDNYWGSNDTTSSIPGDGNFYYNNTFYNNWYGVWLSGNNTAFQNNIIYASGNYNFINTGSGNIEDHNLTTDPNFVDAVSDDLRLQEGSTAIDAGITIDSVPTDISGVPRPQGIAYAIGAYEYQGGR